MLKQANQLLNLSLINCKKVKGFSFPLFLSFSLSLFLSFSLSRSIFVFFCFNVLFSDIYIYIYRNKLFEYIMNITRKITFFFLGEVIKTFAGDTGTLRSRKPLPFHVISLNLSGCPLTKVVFR